MLRVIALLCAAILAAGCRQEKVRVYEVPRESGAARPTQVKVQVPEGWEEAPKGEMRIGSYAIKGNNGAKADLGIIRLPNAGGRDVDNVNRWRSSVGAKALSEEELGKTAQSIKIGGFEGKLHEMAGPSMETDEPTRILGAILVRDGFGWFFKLTGEDKLVAAQKSTFLKFLESYPIAQLGDGHHPGDGHDHGDGDGHDHSAHAGASGDPHAGLDLAAAAPTPEAGPPARSWPAPASWQQQAPGMMQQAKFAARGGKVIITVSEAGGGLAANVLRWRGQVGLPAISEADAEKAAAPLDLNGAQARIIDLPGEKDSMVVIIVPKGQTSVFYKLMGEPAAVAAEKDALIEFAKKVK